MRSYTSNLKRDVDGLVCQRKAKIVDISFMAEKKSGKKTIRGQGQGLGLGLGLGLGQGMLYI